MKWDWAIDSFRSLISLAVIWVIVYLRKKIIPTWNEFRKFLKLPQYSKNQQEQISIHEEQIFLNNAYRVAMWDLLKDPIFTTNTKGEVTYINPEYSKVMGLNDPKDVFGFGYMKLIPKEDKQYISEESKRLVEHPGTDEQDIRFIRQDNGYSVFTECRTAPIITDNGIWIGNLGRLYVLKIEPSK